MPDLTPSKHEYPEPKNVYRKHKVS